MPLLQAEINQHPPDLLSSVAQRNGMDSGDVCWWAVQTRSRQEKQLMRKLLVRNIAFYCPITPHQYRSPAGRARTSYLPLFANYVFIVGDELARYQAMTSGCAANCLKAPEPAELTRQLHAIHLAISAGMALRPESQIPLGTPVRVRAGTFEGVQGIVVERRGKSRLYLKVDFIQQGASLAVEDWEVERI